MNTFVRVARRSGWASATRSTNSPSAMTLPNGWTLSVGEVYPPSWDCSPSFRFGIPEQFVIDPSGKIAYAGALDNAPMGEPR